MIGRRGFLAGMAGIIAAGVAPAIVKQPMKIYVPPKKIITPLAGLGADFDGDTMDWLHEPWVTERPIGADQLWLNNGRLAWKPEMVLQLPMSRTGKVTELVVQPAFKHVVNLPIMASLVRPGEHFKKEPLPLPKVRAVKSRPVHFPLTGKSFPTIRLLDI